MLYTAMSTYVHQLYNTPSDPLRVAAQIASGIGFLGAGAIMKEGYVSGLTTAAFIWIVGALGMMVGLGYVCIALLTSLFTTLLMILISMCYRMIYGQQKQEENV
jgi:putative Mg2+ transporter-C (MgtC) family protein